jgi:transcriptional regulator with XRE-family HTH domain
MKRNNAMHTEQTIDEARRIPAEKGLTPLTDQELVQNIDFASFLQLVRVSKKWSLLGLAGRAGVSYAHLCSLERGTSRPGPSVLRRLVRVLDMPPEQCRRFLELAAESMISAASITLKPAPSVGVNGVLSPMTLEEVEFFKKALQGSPAYATFMFTHTQEPMPKIPVDQPRAF